MDVLCTWMLVSGIFEVIGIVSWRSEKAVGFWNISQQIQVSDIKKYNHAVAKMWFVFGGIFAVIGLAVLIDDSVGIVGMVLGGMFWSIALMVVYTRIEKKYRVM